MTHVCHCVGPSRESKISNYILRNPNRQAEQNRTESRKFFNGKRRPQNNRKYNLKTKARSLFD